MGQPVSSDTETPSWEDYLRRSAVPRDLIDDFLEGPSWAKFDPELGYILQDSSVQWGLDNSHVLQTFSASGSRSRLLYADRKPRINADGNSFTESEQVNDGETWQEYLAGHFREPIGNYGVGGYGVYQSYRRMLREEVSDQGAEYVILYIWGNDPIRSLLRARWTSIYPWALAHARDHHLFHGNFWAHMEMDLSSGALVEKESPLRTSQSLYNMCDPDWMVEAQRDDLATQLSAFSCRAVVDKPGAICELDRRRIGLLAEILEFPFDWGNGAPSPRHAAELLNLYSMTATAVILENVRAFVRDHGKKLLVALNFTAWHGAEFSSSVTEPDGSRRHDQRILDYLVEGGFNFFDMNEVHRLEYKYEDGAFHNYMKKYIVKDVGHYNPRGNHLFAYSIKDSLVRILDPKPVPYQGIEGNSVDFMGYLRSRSS